MANMRLRCIHSCMVLTVVGLLLIYSAFLTSPSYVDSTLDAATGGGETTGSPSNNGGGLVSNKLILSQASSGIISDLSSNDLMLSGTDGEGGRGGGPSSGAGSYSNSAIISGRGDPEDTLLQRRDEASGRFSVPLTASSVFPDASSQDRLAPSEMSQQIAAALLGKSPSGLGGDSSILPTLTQHIHDIVLKKKLESQQNLISGRGRLGGRNNVVWTRDIYESGFGYPNAQVCPNDGLDIRLIILITSAPSHFSARDAIRLTWGHYAQRLDVSMAFIIGKTENETILDGIENEKRLYDDLIVANFMDSYDNLTLKTMATLEWIDTYCNQSEFVLKTDDDMFINVPNLLKFIDRIEPEDKKRPKLYGRLARKWKPVRNKRSKYYISFQQYKKTVYPDFNTGPAYLFSTRIVRPLFEKGMEKTYLKLEDVYTTGILAEELGIKRINIADFANKKVNFHKTGFCALSKLISMHMVAYHEQFELWKKILDGRTKCKIIYTSAKTAAAEAAKKAQQQSDNKNSHSENSQSSSSSSNSNSSSNNNSNNNNLSSSSSNLINSSSNNLSSSNLINSSMYSNQTGAAGSATVTAAASSSSSLTSNFNSSNSPLGGSSSSSSNLITSSSSSFSAGVGASEAMTMTDSSDQPKKK